MNSVILFKEKCAKIRRKGLSERKKKEKLKKKKKVRKRNKKKKKVDIENE
jgi:hypothetical protein